MRDLLRIVAESPTGKDVAVGIVRDGKPQTVTVKLGRMDDKSDPGTPAEPEQALPDGNGEEESAPPDQPIPGEEDETQPQPGTEDNGASTEEGTDAEEAPQDVLGMMLSPIDPDVRKEFGIAAHVNGAVVQVVLDGSAAQQKGIKEGDTIVEVAQAAVKDGAEVAAKVADLKKEGRRNALLLVAAPNGDLRTVALPIE